MASAEVAVIAGRAPIAVDVVEGKTYYWCACGRSKTQPFCDGSHAKEGTSFQPIAYKATKSGKKYFCVCKRSKNKPLCDGTHKTIQDCDMEDMADPCGSCDEKDD